MTDQEDYAEFLREKGLTEEQVQEAGKTVKFTEDKHDSIALGQSKINGLGVIAIKPVFAFTVIPLKKSGVWTRWERYMNHSPNPTMRVVDGESVIATKGIRVGEELTVNYRDIAA